MTDVTRVVGKRGKKAAPTLDEDLADLKSKRSDDVPPRGEYRSLAEQVSQSKYFERNKFVQALKLAFPQNPKLWTIDRYFPHAKGGAIYVEEPTYESEKKDARLKREAMRGEPGRFLIIEVGMENADVMHQLAEMEIDDGLGRSDQ